MGLLLLILIAFLGIIIWVSSYTATSVFRTLKKNHNKNARLVQVLVFLLVFAALALLGFYLLLENMRFER